MNLFKYILTFLFVLSYTCIFSISIYEQEKLYLTQIKNSESDSDKVKIYIELNQLLISSNSMKALFYAKKGLEISKKNNYAVLTANCYERIADDYWFAGNFTSAMEYYLKCLRIGDSLKNNTIIATSKYNIGWIKSIQLSQTSQIYYLYDALKIFVQNKDTAHIILVYDALGLFYRDNKASYKMYKDSCLKYFLTDLKLCGNSYSSNKCACYANLSSFYININDYNNAKLYSKKAILLGKEINDDYNYVAAITTLAQCYANEDSLSKAKDLVFSIFDYFSDPLHEPSRLTSYNLLQYIYSKEKNYEEAYRYLSIYKSLSDSINKKTFNQNLTQKENDYKLEKKDKVLNELQLKNQLQTIKNKQNSYIILGLIIFGILVVIILYFLFKSNKQKQSTNTLLSNQNTIINQKNIEIQQSMYYAKGIQQAFLPTHKYITSQLKRLKNK